MYQEISGRDISHVLTRHAIALISSLTKRISEISVTQHAHPAPIAFLLSMLDLNLVPLLRGEP